MDAPKGQQAKKLGAYYTDRPVADVLVQWAIRHRQDKVLDPSFGGGVFLAAAAKHLTQLGGSPDSIYGIELDANVHAQVSLELHSSTSLNPNHLLQSDFFDIEAKQLPKFDAVIGNPPFIRYQGFNNSKALQQMQKPGVPLSKLSNSWAAFLVHAISFLKKGGRLAMIAPSELAHAKYAKPVLEYLLNSFGQVKLVSFQKPLFPKLNQNALFILAEEKGKSTPQISLQHSESIFHTSVPQHQERVSARELLDNHYGLSFYTLPKEARVLYQHLAHSSLLQRLGDIAQIGIGYVTGNNDYFHLSRAEAKDWKLSKHLLTPSVYKVKAFSGLSFNVDDWVQAEQQGNAGFLLEIEPTTKVNTTLQKYLDYGQEQSIHKAYKCRQRSPWYAVPHVYQADAFLSYMSGSRALLVANHAKAVAPNTLHILRLKPDTVSANDLSVLWQNSLTMLSTEIEGHALGGGMLKLEPNEAKQVLIPNAKVPVALYNRLDKLLRQNKTKQALELGDEIILGNSLGLKARDMEVLSSAVKHLRHQRNKG